MTRLEYLQYADVVALDMYWLVSGCLEVLSADLRETLYLLMPGDTYGEVIYAKYFVRKKS